MAATDALERAMSRFIDDLGGTGTPGIAVVLYGSAARGDWDAHRSDVNLLVVVDDPSPARLGELTNAVRRWHEQGFTPPLLMGRSEWQRATDVFPIEVVDMQLAHRLLVGADPVSGLVVPPDALRWMLEAELRGKLVRLRQAYVRFRDAEPVLGGFASASASEFLVLLRATAVLAGRDPGATAADTVSALADHLGSGVEAVRHVVAHRRAREWSCPAPLFAEYLEAVRHLVDLIDSPSRGAS
jgi:hypothetical protein